MNDPHCKSEAKRLIVQYRGLIKEQRETIDKLKEGLEYYRSKRHLGTLPKGLLDEYWFDKGEKAEEVLKEVFEEE